MRMKYIVQNIWLLLIVATLSLVSCQKDTSLEASPYPLLPEIPNTQLDKSLNEIFAPYNCRVTYRYVENLLPRDWYFITPVEESKVLPISKFLHEYWLQCLEDGSSVEFVQKTCPSQIVLVGSPALQLDGRTEIMGQAEGGTLLRFTRCNDYDMTDIKWIEKQLTTAFHEYAHILHQTFRLPDEYRQITPQSYTKNGWMAVSDAEALMMGMVSPYATSSVQEDFAELFAFVIIQPDEMIQLYLGEKKQEDWLNLTPEDLLALNKGSEIIRQKYVVLSNMLKEHNLDITKVRQSLQQKLNNLQQ